jgi:hypothetical protein
VSKGPRVTFHADIGGTTYMIGDDLGEQTGEIEFTVTITYKPDNIHAQLVKNGQIIANERLKGSETSVQFRDRVDPARSDWYRFEVLDRVGQALAITNPIFVNSHASGRRGHP